MKLPMSIWLPAFAALFIATIGGGLGVIFMVLLSVGHDTIPHSWGRTGEELFVIILGVSIVVGVPIIGALVHSWVGKRP